MRILDKKNNRVLRSILIMLTPSELDELMGSLQSLNVEKNFHVHVDDEAYKRMITIGLYTPENLHHFSPEVVRIIREDE